MNSSYNKDSLFNLLRELITKQNEINWSLLRDLPISGGDNHGLRVTFSDNLRTLDMPFQKHLGYIGVEESAKENFESVFSLLLAYFKGNNLQLANLFILYYRLDVRGDDFLKDILSKFKSAVGSDCEKIFLLLVESLNEKYFSHHHHYGAIPTDIKTWLDIFHSAQYFTPLNDPIISIISLIRKEKERHIDYRWLLPMNPLLRSILMGWYSFEIDVDEFTLLNIINGSETEAAFIAATILDDISHDKIAPLWLTNPVLAVFIKKYWNNIGKSLLLHVYGISYRNKNENELFKFLKVELNTIFKTLLISDNSNDDNWLKNLDFTDSYIALFNWMHINEIEFSNILASKKEIITKGFIDSLHRITTNYAELISKTQSMDPFNSYSLHEEIYQRACGYWLLFILDADVKSIKRIGTLFYSFKTIYYGGYEATLLSKRFTEFILLILVTIHSAYDLTELMIENLKSLLSDFNKTLLIPYIHLAERDNEIWDTAYKYPPYYNFSKLLINIHFQKLLSSSSAQFFKPFFDVLNSVKIAEWPFERIINLSDEAV